MRLIATFARRHTGFFTRFQQLATIAFQQVTALFQIAHVEHDRIQS